MPTPVQRKALPVILTGSDAVVMARTGSGKTAAFCIPLLEQLIATPKGQHGNHVRAVILSPTRELSIQTLTVLRKLASGLDINAIGIHGGESMQEQFERLASRPDVIVATPGRLAHHLTEIPDFGLGGCRMCILDEADRLLEMGLAQQIRVIAQKLPSDAQKVMLSATLPKMLVEFTKSGFAVDPTVVRLDQEARLSEELRISFVTCRSMEKEAALLYLLQTIRDDQERHASQRTGLTLVFAATRHHVEYITTLLECAGYNATMIYGTLDHQARQINLQAFRSGERPILVVTDVAARGIDVPLIDHVIHYHFPPSPKLFVHRSGRAARAGRIGFAWSLVEPDELAYCMDLHLFLGRKPTSSVVYGEDKKKSDIQYTLDEMTPEMVHYGSLPESVMTEEVENVQRLLNAELSGSKEAEHLASLAKVCKNAMKQYKRTRAEASREGVRRAKAILEGDRLETGQRVQTLLIPPHPLLKQASEQAIHKTGLGDADNLRKRQDFLQAMSQFRPKETVFEAFATGKNKELSVVSHVDKGRTTMNKKNDSTAALYAMKNMRRQMRIAHDKGTALVVAGSDIAMDKNNEGAKKSDGGGDDQQAGEATQEGDDAGVKSVAKMLSESSAQMTEGKKRLSKAERKRVKKDPSAEASTAQTHEHDDAAATQSKSAKQPTTYRDPQYYIDNDYTSNTEEARRARQVEAAMQPSASSNTRGSVGQALRLEEAMLEIVGDERDELVKKQRMMRWDKAKRKYVQTTVGSELSGDSKSKKMRLESGQLVKTDKMKLGELYEKWQKKTHKSIGRQGVFDDAGKGDVGTGVSGKPFYTPANGSSGKGGKNDDDGDKVKDVAAIQRERKIKENNKLKNMKKGERRKIESKNRKKRMSSKMSSMPMSKKQALVKKMQKRK
jgi:ATP-dependent RNA helicase DDX54/DBP10